MTNQYGWNIFFSIFFLLVLAVSVVVLDRFAYRPFYAVGIGDMLLVALATFRLIRLFVYDSVTAFFREQFFDAVAEADGTVALRKPKRGARLAVANLLSCPWCFGMWATATVLFFYFLTPYTFYVILMLALAGIATLLQLLANMIGWRAEALKRSVGE